MKRSFLVLAGAFFVVLGLANTGCGSMPSTVATDELGTSSSVTPTLSPTPTRMPPTDTPPTASPEPPLCQEMFEARELREPYQRRIFQR